MDSELHCLAFWVCILMFIFGIGCHFSWCFSLLLQIDKDGANPDRVMQELSSIGLMPEDWGGDTPMVKVIIFLSYEKGFHWILVGQFHVLLYRLPSFVSLGEKSAGGGGGYLSGCSSFYFQMTDKCSKRWKCGRVTRDSHACRRGKKNYYSGYLISVVIFGFIS